jgi:ubiquinone biosynthesis O-methyltransferase
MKSSTINKVEIEKFSKMASEWWNPPGKFKPLHKFYPLRIVYIRDGAAKHFKIKSNNQPLKILNILDFGCGGGLFSEPMSRLGASVTGIDASKTNINIAKIHSKKNKLKINYICASPEKLNINQKFDIILNMEVVGKVGGLNYFINQSSQKEKKMG